MITPSSFPYGMVSAGNMHDITSLQYATLSTWQVILKRET